MPRPKGENVTCIRCGNLRKHFCFGFCRSCRNGFYKRRDRLKKMITSGKRPTRGNYNECYICGCDAVGYKEFLPFCRDHKALVGNVVDAFVSHETI